MRTVSTLTILATIALIAVAPVCRAASARAEVLPIEDKELAKLDKEETKRRRAERQMEDDMSDSNQNDNSQCGTVSIGNGNSSNSNKGTSSVLGTSTTVIVTGDVFNTASCGR
jgi:hypothetical protein